MSLDNFLFSFHRLHKVFKMSAKRKLSSVDGSEDLFRSPVKPQISPRKKSKKSDDDTLVDDSLFGELVIKAGYILKKGDQPNLLSMIFR